MAANSGPSIKARLYQILTFFSVRDKLKALALTLVQMGLTILDLVGIALIGLLAAVAIRGVSSSNAPSRLDLILNQVGLQDSSLQTKSIIVGGIAATVLIFRTVASMYLNRKTMTFLSVKGNEISKIIVSRLFNSNYLILQRINRQDIIYTLTSGVTTMTVGVIGVGISAISDIFTLTVIVTGLIVVDPIIAALTSVIFGSLGIALYFNVQRKAVELGRKDTQLSIAIANETTNAISLYRELNLRGNLSEYESSIQLGRQKLTNTVVSVTFMPFVSKYMMEIAVVVSAILVSAIQFTRTDAIHAIATLSIFIAASSRIAPAAMRLQQSLVLLRGNLSMVVRCLELITHLENANGRENQLQPSMNFVPSVRARNASFRYGANLNAGFSNLNLEIEPGSIVGVVGPSGAGKTTFTQALIGMYPLSGGELLVSGVSAEVAFRLWPGEIAYVPQNLELLDRTLAENISLTPQPDQWNEEKLLSTIQDCGLDEYLSTLPNGLNTIIGGANTQLSGGQLQRLAIARAMYTNPKLLVLDEATSALDGQTEKFVIDSIRAMRERHGTTVVLIAHRLATLLSCDKIFYFESGQLIHAGNFDEVRKNVPNFESQAKLMGL